MTVGIAAICQEENGPKVILAADRMITTGQNPQIEYEHTRSKIQTVWNNDIVTCMAVASGTVSFIEGFFERLSEKLEDDDPPSVEYIANASRDAYTELGRETVENQLLSKFDLELSDLTGDQTGFDSDILSSFLSDVADAQDQFSQKLEVLLGGIDGLGPQIYSIQGFDLDPQNTIGYHAVGSGTQPARSVFIRNRYDTTCSVRRGVVNTIEAKRQSEEARGVGSEMDIAVVNPPNSDMECCHSFDDARKEVWKEFYEDIKSAENDAREDIFNNEDLDYDPDTEYENS